MMTESIPVPAGVLPLLRPSSITVYTDHAKCGPGDHDRSLPDGRTDDITLAADGLMGCSDCAEPLFYCHRDNRWWHLDPDGACFLAHAWGVDCDTHGLTCVTEEQRFIAPGGAVRYLRTLGCGCLMDDAESADTIIR